MNAHEPCAAPGCANFALSHSLHCAVHLPDRGAYTDEMKNLLAGGSVFENLHLVGVALAGLDLSGKEFRCCDWSGVALTDCLFEKTRLNLVFLDRSRLTRCPFTGAKVKWSVFAEAQLTDCSFTNADVFRCNLNAARLSRTPFTNATLYSTRFISARFEDVEFVNCNLLRTHFEFADIGGVRFANSNTQEAFFDQGRIEE
jgi:uncharacterized protein YjbI with pentapeptide repeats